MPVSVPVLDTGGSGQPPAPPRERRRLTTPLPAVSQRPDPVAAMRRLQTPEETGVPVSRNGALSGLKPQNGHAPPKPPLGSPSPRLCKTGPPQPAALGEPGKKVKKPAPLQPPLSPPLQTAQGLHGAHAQSGGRRDSHRPSSGDSRGAGLSTSPKLVAAVNGHGPGATALDTGDSSGSSPEHSASSDSPRPPSTPRSGAARFCDSQGRTPVASPPGAQPAGDDAKAVKPRSPVRSNAALEPANTMSPPPAKKLALSAKKVGVGASRRRQCQGAVVGERDAGPRDREAQAAGAFPGSGAVQG